MFRSLLKKKVFYRIVIIVYRPGSFLSNEKKKSLTFSKPFALKYHRGALKDHCSVGPAT